MAAPPTNMSILSEASEVSTPSFIILFYFYFFLISLCSQQIRGKIHRTGRIFPEHAERSFLDPKYSFVVVNEAKVRPIKNQLGLPNTLN